MTKDAYFACAKLGIKATPKENKNNEIITLGNPLLLGAAPHIADFLEYLPINYLKPIFNINHDSENINLKIS
jgi:hypothetical protein